MPGLVHNAAWLIALILATGLVLLPRPLITLVSVMTFGVLMGLTYSTTGVLLAALVTYYAGRLLPKLLRNKQSESTAAASPAAAQTHNGSSSIARLCG